MAKKKDTGGSQSNDVGHHNQSNKNAYISPADYPEGEEPDFDDPSDFEELGDEDLLSDIIVDKPRETEGVESVIVVDGVPQVGADRIEKLQSVITKLFSKFGEIVNEFYPKNENGTTKGYIFIEYKTVQSALDAVVNTNNHKLDKNHTFLVNLFTDFKKYEEIPDEWTPPDPQPYKEQRDLYYYLLEPDAYDQFCVICDSGNPVQIWLNTIPYPTKLQERARWTEKYGQWSPLGTYLATIHAKGVALWGGPEFEQIMRFTHVDVQFIEFSPCENYLVTYSPNGLPEHSRLIIWDIRRGEVMRSFDPDGPTVWPTFKWSKDDKYFAKIGTDVLSIYETPSFGLLDKKSVKLPGIKDFAWSPTDNILAYWVSESKDVPARVVLMEVPSRQEVRANNLFNVCDCKIHWQKSGDYLCVKVDRYTRCKKEKGSETKYINMYYNFEIFHLREKNIPVDSVEIKEPIHAFAWEPVGSTFAIIHGETSNINVSFYGLKTGQKPVLLRRMDKRSCNTLFWSPVGQFIVLADLRTNGTLEFVDTSDFTIMNTSEHYRMSDVEWDPTGRYVVTATSKWKSKDDLGYWIWTFQGRILSRNNMQRFWQLQWRPRPPSLLSAEQQKEIKKSLKKYSAQFESKDKMRLTRASKDLIEKRAASSRKFEEYRQSLKKIWEEQKERRLQLRNNVDTDTLDADTQNMEEEVVEFFVKQEEIILD